MSGSLDLPLSPWEIAACDAYDLLGSPERSFVNQFYKRQGPLSEWSYKRGIAEAMAQAGLFENPYAKKAFEAAAEEYEEAIVAQEIMQSMEN